MVRVKFVWILVMKLLVQMNCHLVRLRCCDVLEVIRTAIIAYWDMMENLLLVLPWCEFPWWQYSPKEVFSDKCHRSRSCPCLVPASRRMLPHHTSPCPGPSPSHPPSCSAHTCTSAADDPLVSQSRRRRLPGPFPGWKHQLALSHFRHYQETMLNGHWPHPR